MIYLHHVLTKQVESSGEVFDVHATTHYYCVTTKPKRFTDSSSLSSFERKLFKTLKKLEDRMREKMGRIILIQLIIKLLR